MSEEKRKDKRLTLEVKLFLEHLNEDGRHVRKYSNVVVKDISRSGIGFITNQQIKVNDFFDTKVELWTKEMLDTTIKVVREAKLDEGTYFYGGKFIGLSDLDAMKIDLYQVFN